MANTTIMSIRIDSDLLDSLKIQAASVGRIVSSEVVQLIKQNLTVAKVPQKPLKKSEGLFAQFEAPDLNEMREVRAT